MEYSHEILSKFTIFSCGRIDECFYSKQDNQDEDMSLSVQQSLFERLCPLLVIRMLPLEVFNDLSMSVMYGQLPNRAIVHGIFLYLYWFFFLFPRVLVDFIAALLNVDCLLVHYLFFLFPKMPNNYLDDS